MSARSKRRRRERNHRREVLKQAKLDHEQRVERLTKSGRLDKLQNSGFIRRHRNG